MLNVMIWGAGKNCEIILKAIRKDMCNLIGIVDSNEKIHYTLYNNSCLIVSPKILLNICIDYVIISVRVNEEILKQCEEMGIAKDKIIDYWKTDVEYDFIDENVKKIFLMEMELKKYKRQLKNIPYELGIKTIPLIRPAEELLEKIINEKRSLSRFGDGELEIMQGRERPWFQELDYRLAERLKEVFNSKDERIIIALADNFGSLDCYTEQAADGIREYLENGIREDLMKVIDTNRIYYDTYVTRPYIIYKDKSHAVHIFELFKKIWNKRNILFVEGELAFTGIRNDLFDEAASIRRILAPSKNAFLSYKRLLNIVKENVFDDTLVLISLGPTATVLAYDLTIEGIQALDIGQLDNEYEWYLRGVSERVKIPGKCVAEISGGHDVQVIEDITYTKQIIAKVELV